MYTIPRQPMYAPRQPMYAPRQPVYAPRQPMYTRQKSIGNKKTSPFLLIIIVIAILGNIFIFYKLWNSVSKKSTTPKSREEMNVDMAKEISEALSKKTDEQKNLTLE